jgi:hypothetical protein
MAVFRLTASNCCTLYLLEAITTAHHVLPCCNSCTHVFMTLLVLACPCRHLLMPITLPQAGPGVWISCLAQKFTRRGDKDGLSPS